jgi:formylglycine-generating enzyme required for sulfatase activity
VKTLGVDLRRRLECAFAVVVLAASVGCQRQVEAVENKDSGAPAPKSSILPPLRTPPPRQGMVYIPGGALVAGTPPDGYPRLADEEIPGQQLILKGFYVDVYPYPNEEGAIPLTNVNRDEAAKLCSERDKRLCSELEWERACKGPNNQVYEYGDRYRPEVCATGTSPLLRPSGLRVGCRSDYGVRDLHGGAWEWTRSSFGRGIRRELATVRGGNAKAGELVARCANAMGRHAEERSPHISFRCCVGPAEVPEVELSPSHPRKLEARDRLDRAILPRLTAALPEEARSELEKRGRITPYRMWSWWPVGNDELLLTSFCAGSGRRASCGVLVSRVTLGNPNTLAWAQGGTWEPTLHAEHDPRDLWLSSGDDPGAFRRLVSYVWGKVTVGARERRVAVTKPKTSAKKK